MDFKCEGFPDIYNFLNKRLNEENLQDYCQILYYSFFIDLAYKKNQKNVVTPDDIHFFITTDKHFEIINDKFSILIPKYLMFTFFLETIQHFESIINTEKVIEYYNILKNNPRKELYLFSMHQNPDEQLEKLLHHCQHLISLSGKDKFILSYNSDIHHNKIEVFS